MTALYLVVGEKPNILAQGLVTATSEKAGFGKAGLYDDDSSVLYASDSLASAQEIVVDGNQRYALAADYVTLVEVAQGFEGTWALGAPVGWTKGTTGTGTVTEETSIVHAGSKAVKFDKENEADASFIWADFLIPSGWTMSSRVWSRGPSPNGGTIVRIQDLSNGLYLGSGSPWGVSVADFVLPTSGSTYTVTAINSGSFVIQPMSVTKRDRTVIRVLIGMPSGANNAGDHSYVDEFSLFGAPDFLSLHRTNFRPHVTLTLSRSLQEPGSTTWTPIWTAPGQEDIFTKLAAPSVFRFHKLEFVPAAITAASANVEKPVIGEMVLSQATNLLRPTQGLRTKWTQPQSRAGRGRFRFRETAKPHRTLELEFLHTEDVASFVQMRDEIYHRSGGGVFPVTIAMPAESQVPSATPTGDSANVVFGVLAEDLEMGKELLPHYRQVLRVEEFPAPTPWFG